MNRTAAIFALAMLAATTTAMAEEAGNMIIWPVDSTGCEHINTGSAARELAAQDAAVLRSLASNLFAAQADMAITLTEESQTTWLYTEYDEALGMLTEMGTAIAGDIARLDRSVLSFEDTDESLGHRDARRAQRLCREQANLLNEYSGLWTDVLTAAAQIMVARRDAGVAAVPWRTDSFGYDDRQVIEAQFRKLNLVVPEPPACLDALDRRLREHGVGDCVDK